MPLLRPPPPLLQHAASDVSTSALLGGRAALPSRVGIDGGLGSHGQLFSDPTTILKFPCALRPRRSPPSGVAWATTGLFDDRGNVEGPAI